MAGNSETTDVEVLEKKNKLLLNQIQFLTDELHKTKEELEAEKKKHSEDNDAAASDIKHMVEESIELKKRLAVLQDDLNDMEDELISTVSNKSLRNENVLLRKDIRTLKKECEEATSQYEIVRDQYNSAIIETNELRQEVESKKSELLVKTNELKRAWRELEQNREDMALMMREYAEKSAEDAEPTNWKKMEDENGKLKGEVERLTRNNETLTTLMNELKMEIARINEQESMLPALSDSSGAVASTDTLESHGVVTALFSPEDISTALRLCINSLVVMMNVFTRSSNQELIRRVSVLNLLKKQVVLVNDEVQVVVHREDQHRQALMEQEMKVEDAEAAVKALREENEKLTAQLTSKNYDLHSTQQQLQERMQEMEVLQTAGKRREARAGEKQLEAIRASFNKRLQESADAKCELVREKEALRAQVSELQREVETKKAELAHREQEAARQEKLAATKDTMVEALRKQLKEQTAALQAVKEEMSKAQSSTTVEASELKQTLIEKEKKIQQLQDDLDDAEDSLDDEKEVTEKLRKENRELSEARDRLRGDVKELEHDNEELTEKLKNQTVLGEQLKKKSAECMAAAKEKEAAQAQLAAVQQELSLVQQELEGLKRLQSRVVVPTAKLEEVEGDRIHRTGSGVA